MSFLSENDGITINKERHLSSAKLKAMTLINAGFSNCNRRMFNLPGIDAFANFKLMLNSMYEGGYITKHDLTVALKTAFLMSGGNCNPKHHVDEQTLLDLERETFLSLCGERKTIDRIEHMLKKKKPLRN
jgi:3-hydroxyacyl-CoA dehydrogenase